MMSDLVGQNLAIICNGCGQLMRNMGEWPVQYPREAEPKNIVQAIRYACNVCKIPSDKFKPGYPNIITIIGESL